MTSWVLWKQSLRGRLRYAYLLGFRSFVAEREEISFGERKGLEQDSVPSKSQPYARALWKVFGLSQKRLMFIPNGQVFQFLPLSTIDVVPPGKGRACPWVGQLSAAIRGWTNGLSVLKAKGCQLMGGATKPFLKQSGPRFNGNLRWLCSIFCKTSCNSVLCLSWDAFLQGSKLETQGVAVFLRSQDRSEFSYFYFSE